MRKLSSWLPADTRAVELASCFGMLLCALGLLLGLRQLGADQPDQVAGVILMCFGLLQAVGAVKEVPPLRAVTAFIAGMWWLWSGLTGTEAGDFAALGLAVSCLYAFLLHSVEVSHD